MANLEPSESRIPDAESLKLFIKNNNLSYKKLKTELKNP